jgi:hypothetical protein
MKYKILQLTTENGIPIVTGAVDVSKEAGGKYIAYGDFVRGTNTKWKRGPEQVVAYLHEWKAGEFIVVAEQAVLDAIDPTDKGKTVSEMDVDFVAADHGGAIGEADFYDAMGVEPPQPPIVLEI